MTVQEAIEILRDTPIDIRSTREDDIHTLYATAQGMAIEALQQGCEKVAEGCEDYITVKRQFVLDAINIGLSGYISDDDKLTLEGMGITVSEMPTTDLSGFCDRLWRSAYDRGYERCKDDAINAIEMLLEQSEDDVLDTTWNNAIRGAINAVKHHTKSAQPEQECEKCIFKPFKQFQPERKKGEWINRFDGDEWFWFCSACKEQWYEEDLWMGGNEFPNFCPNCGAEMRATERNSHV